jgi:hypothetical protein
MSIELTPQQLADLEFTRQQTSMHLDAEVRRSRNDLIRLAKEVLFENDRSKELSERGVSVDDIIATATKFENYIKQ